MKFYGKKRTFNLENQDDFYLLFKREIQIVLKQSAENHRNKCHQLWLRLRHAAILISNVRISASMKVSWMYRRQSEFESGGGGG